MTKTALSTLSSANGQRLLGGLHERVEARLHHLITRFAHPGIADRRWHLENVPYCHALALNPFDTRLAPIDVFRKGALHGCQCMQFLGEHTCMCSSGGGTAGGM